MKTQTETNRATKVFTLHHIWSEDKTTINAKKILEALSFCKADIEITPDYGFTHFRVDIHDNGTTHQLLFYTYGPIKWTNQRRVYSTEELEALENIKVSHE
jgi:hypothetical protein